MSGESMEIEVGGSSGHEDVYVDLEGNVLDGMPDELITPGEKAPGGEEGEEGEGSEEASAGGDEAPPSETPDHHDDEDGGVAEAEEMANAETPEEREAIRERRRQERQDRKNRRRENEDNMRSALASRDAELAELRNRLSLVETRNVSTEVAQLKNHQQQLNRAYIAQRQRLAEATRAADGESVADATEKMYQIRDRFQKTVAIESAMAQASRQPPPLDPAISNLASTWATRNKWYNPAGNDQDSAITRVIDQTLHGEGFNPATLEYWDELDRRVKKTLPHRSTRQGPRMNNQNPPKNPPPKTVVGGSGKNTSTPVGTGAPAKKGFKLSADRVQALKDGGMWDDPGKRAAAIKNFQKFDKENSGR